MPTYEYRCPKGHGFEKFFPQMTNRRRMRCPKCGQLAERLISSGGGLVFKGSGFYITDYKRAGQPAESEGKSESKSETKSESKAESKSETKSETKAGSKSELTADVKPSKSKSKKKDE
jgi:putative FmdB family regulatory protein